MTTTRSVLSELRADKFALDVSLTLLAFRDIIEDFRSDDEERCVSANKRLEMIERDLFSPETQYELSESIDVLRADYKFDFDLQYFQTLVKGIRNKQYHEVEKKLNDLNETLQASIDKYFMRSHIYF